MPQEFADIFEEYIEHHPELARIEGEQGVKGLHKLASDLGYSQQPFAYGSPLELFLADNPGAVEALQNWVRDNGSDEWRDDLESTLPEKETIVTNNDDEWWVIVPLGPRKPGIYSSYQDALNAPFEGEVMTVAQYKELGYAD